MAAEPGAVWAIDIGNDSLKALYLSTERGVVEVLGFDNIRHGKILNGESVTDAEREELIALSLRKLVTKYDLSMDDVVISVPSQNSFARFVNLPPVEEKKIPEMVEFEAAQQIPFGIEDVQWDWQQMTDADGTEIKVGIFAIKNDIVNEAMYPFNNEDIDVSIVQMTPMALYNFLLHDRPDMVASDSQATAVINIGASNTDLVVCTKSSVWQRCILIGGNNFTKAIADTFRLNFEKAEKLKRTAPMSKYARQIFQAMRPTFTDLASEIQRSLGFYASSNPNAKVVKIIAMGGGTRMRGLLKYLQQTLQLPVERPDTFKRLSLGPGVSQAKFHENVNDFGIVYGLAAQGLGIGRIESNLLPRTISRSRAWAQKGRYFIAAACMLLAVSFLSFARTFFDRMSYNGQERTRDQISQLIGNVQDDVAELTQIESESTSFNTTTEQAFESLKYRDLIPKIYETVLSVLPNKENNPSQAALYEAFEKGDVETIMQFDRNERKQIFIVNSLVNYTNDLETARFESAEVWRRTRDTFQDDEEEEEEEQLSERDLNILQSLGIDTTGYSRQIGGSANIKDCGFAVTLIGYSPYGNNLVELMEFIDPVGVEDQPEKWGMITRLAHLDDFVEDGNSPFELYGRTVDGQMNIEIKEIDLANDIPPIGIGLDDIRYKPTSNSMEEPEEEWILIDPLTREIINKVAVYEDGKQVYERNLPVYQTNDHWFVINFKLLWRDAPILSSDSSDQGTAL